MFYGTAVAVYDKNYYQAVLYEDLTGCIGHNCADKKDPVAVEKPKEDPLIVIKPKEDPV